MGAVQVGDLVVGSDGNPTLVTLKSGIHDRPCFRISFGDGTSVVCDNVHLWRVVTSRRQKTSHDVLDAQTLFERHQQLVREGRRSSMWVVSGSGIDLRDVAGLPVDPWLLGAWLGDGDTRGNGFTVGHAGRRRHGHDVQGAMATNPLGEAGGRELPSVPVGAARPMLLWTHRVPCRDPGPPEAALRQGAWPQGVGAVERVLRQPPHQGRRPRQQAHPTRLPAVRLAAACRPPPGLDGHRRLVQQAAPPGRVHHDGRSARGRCPRAAAHPGHQPLPLRQALRQCRPARSELARHRVHAPGLQPVRPAAEGRAGRRRHDAAEAAR